MNALRKHYLIRCIDESNIEKIVKKSILSICCDAGSLQEMGLFVLFSCALRRE